MNHAYEYKKVSITDFVADLRQLGDQGWEVVAIPSDFLAQRCVTVRRCVSVPPEPAAWEYRLFETANVPPQWWDHIRGYGWTILDPPHIESHSVSAAPTRRVHMAKRPGSWKGTDDGDVAACLAKLGYIGGRLSEVIAEILKIKWELSQQQGNDVGTRVATRYWLVQRLLPTLWA